MRTYRICLGGSQQNIAADSFKQSQDYVAFFRAGKLTEAIALIRLAPSDYIIEVE